MYFFCSNNTNKLSPQEQTNTFLQCLHCSNNTNKLSPQELFFFQQQRAVGSNNTNKLSPQELKMRTIKVLMVQIIQINLALKNHIVRHIFHPLGSNNTNKLSPQELGKIKLVKSYSSNNTNKLSPQEPSTKRLLPFIVQIIQINLALKNYSDSIISIERFK